MAPPKFAADNRSALLSAVLSVDPEDMGARHTVDWMRTHLPGAADGPASTSADRPR
ncbi:putative membrane mmpL11 domain protein [Mycobacterium kansasii]|uniref:Putative membrane mmpL11 domain protein n=1 Tax=Mycobacterium kansasii TaxID=1768 RepID=A0A1V3WR47_MYCKA|nr:putative membrane mmpL11 domain protein [Mycobacterium kansasii]